MQPDKENKRAAPPAPDDPHHPKRSRLDPPPEAYLAARVKEAHALCAIGSHAAARELLAKLTTVSPPHDPLSTSTEENTSSPVETSAFKFSALYWCARASVEEAAGDWSSSAALLSRGAAFVTNPAQVEALNTSVREFEKRREASAGKAVTDMLLESPAIANATAAPPPSAPSAAVESLLAKTAGYSVPSTVAIGRLGGGVR